MTNGVIENVLVFVSYLTWYDSSIKLAEQENHSVEPSKITGRVELTFTQSCTSACIPFCQQIMSNLGLSNWSRLFQD